MPLQMESQLCVYAGHPHLRGQSYISLNRGGLELGGGVSTFAGEFLKGLKSSKEKYVESRLNSVHKPIQHFRCPRGSHTFLSGKRQNKMLTEDLAQSFIPYKAAAA